MHSTILRCQVAAQTSLGNLRLELVSSPDAVEEEEEEEETSKKEAALVKALSLTDFLPGARRKKKNKDASGAGRK